MSVCIQTTQLSKRYGRFLAVDDLSLSVEMGEVLGLLGLNGAGKSTTLYMLAGLARPTSGAISVFGKDLRRRFLDIAPQIGVLIERPAFYDYLTARDNLLLCAHLAGREVTVDRTLDLVGLLPMAQRKVGTFSTGMRQRLGLAQALLLDPALLILDEPTSGLDPEGQADILNLLRSLVANTRVTMVFSSHMMHEVEELCDRVAIIHNGRLVACERTETLRAYDETRVDVLLDAPESAVRRLREQPWVEGAEARAGRVEVSLHEPQVPQLATFLMSAGYRVTGIIPRRHTLQEYFLKVLHS